MAMYHYTLLLGGRKVRTAVKFATDLQVVTGTAAAHK